MVIMREGGGGGEGWGESGEEKEGRGGGEMGEEKRGRRKEILVEICVKVEARQHAGRKIKKKKNKKKAKKQIKTYKRGKKGK